MKWYEVEFHWLADGEIASTVVVFMNKHKLKPGEFVPLTEEKDLVGRTLTLHAMYYNDAELEK